MGGEGLDSKAFMMLHGPAEAFLSAVVLDGTLEHAMEFENFALERCARSAEHKEYVSAFAEKRKPDLKRLRD